jgi:hypothetical protein
MKERRSEMFWRKKQETQIIKFASVDPVIPLPVPMKSIVPEWYKKSTRFLDGEKKPRILKIGENKYEGNRSMKACIPFFDGLTTGYAALLWQDVEVIRTPTGPEFRWLLPPEPIDGRDGKGLELIPIPLGHNKMQFVWHNPFSMQTPPGYSILITHPLNRFDLPFVTLSGVHDSDALMPDGHLPFYLSEEFEGVIPRGTPMFQIIPFKRDDWQSVDGGEAQRLESHRRAWEGMTKLIGDYKDKYWHRKNYN